MSFTATELNVLILRYLQESGLNHTAFLFARESQMDLQDVAARELPNGALVNVVQKGLSFVDFESRAGLEGVPESEIPKLGLLDAVSDESAKQRARLFLNNDGAGTSGQTQRDRDREARNERMGAGGVGSAGPTSNGGGGGPNHGITPKRDRSAHPSQLSPTNSTSSQSGIGPGRGGGGGGGGMHGSSGGSSTPNGQYNKKQAAMNGLSRDLLGKASDVYSQKATSVL